MKSLWDNGYTIAFIYLFFVFKHEALLRLCRCLSGTSALMRIAVDFLHSTVSISKICAFLTRNLDVCSANIFSQCAIAR